MKIKCKENNGDENYQSVILCFGQALITKDDRCLKEVNAKIVNSQKWIPQQKKTVKKEHLRYETGWK